MNQSKFIRTFSGTQRREDRWNTTEFSKEYVGSIFKIEQ
jgi:hypothetical protein